MILRRDVNRPLTHDEVDDNFVELKNDTISNKEDLVQASSKTLAEYPTLADAMADNIPDGVVFIVNDGDDSGYWRRDSSLPEGAVFLRKDNLKDFIDANPKSVNNINFAPRINTALVDSRSNHWLQTEEGLEVKDPVPNPSTVTYETVIPDELPALPVNIYVDATVTAEVGDPRILVQIYDKEGNTIRSTYVSLEKTSGKIFVFKSEYPTAHKIRLILRPTEDAVIKLRDIYIGVGDFPEGSFRLDQEELNILKRVNPINLTDYFQDENQYGAFWEKEGDVFSTTAISPVVMFSIDTTEITGKLYISFMSKSSKTNTTGMLYSFYDEDGDLINAVGPEFLKNENWREYYKELNIPENCTRLRVKFERNYSEGEEFFLKNFIISEQPHRQGSGRGLILPTASTPDSGGSNQKISDYFLDNYYQFPENDIVYLGTSRSTNTRISKTETEFQRITSYYVEVPEKLKGTEVYIKPFVEVIEGSVNYINIDSYDEYNTVIGNRFIGSALTPVKFTIPENAVRLHILVVCEEGGSYIFKGMYMGEKPYKEGAVLSNVYSLKNLKYEKIVNKFPYKTLTPFTETGNSGAFITVEDGEPVLNIPEGVNVHYRIESDSGFERMNMSFAVKSPHNNFAYGIMRGINRIIYQNVLLENEWEEVVTALELKGYSELEIEFRNEGDGIVQIKNPIISEAFVRQGMQNIVYEGVENETGLKSENSLMEAIAKGTTGVFNIGTMMVKSNVDNPTSKKDYDLIGDRRQPSTKKMQNVTFIDTQGYTFKWIDSRQNMWFSGYGTVRFIHKDDFMAALSAPELKPAGTIIADGVTELVEDETWRVFDTDQLSESIVDYPIYAIRELGNGEMSFTEHSKHFYTTNNRTQVHEVQLQDRIGSLIDGWFHDVYDDIVLTGGYFNRTTPGHEGERGKGRLLMSLDGGKTFRTIFDLETDPIFDGYEEAREACHLHGVAYDPWWDRVWLVPGDYSPSVMDGKIFYCDNYRDDVPVWESIPVHLDMQTAREQHCTIYPMENCFLIGTDMNPSGIMRMARVGRDKGAMREMVLHLNSQLSHVPCSYHRWNSDLPVIIYNGIQFVPAQDDPDDPSRPSIAVTINGWDFFKIWEDTLKVTVNETAQRCFYLPSHEIFASKRNDGRFPGDEGIVYGTMGEWK